MNLISYHPDRDVYQTHEPIEKETFITIFTACDNLDLYLPSCEDTKICDVFGTQKNLLESGLPAEIQGLPFCYENNVYMSLGNGEIWRFKDDGFSKLVENI